MPRAHMILTSFLIAVVFSLFSAPLAAQTQNLLVNPGFEQNVSPFGPYRASLGDPEFNFAEGWAGWITLTPRTEAWQNQNIYAYPHNGQFFRSGSYTQDMGRSGGTFTAAAYQTVNNIANGTTLRASVTVYMENGLGTGARVRIGIGSNVGGDPTSPAVIWSPFNTSVNGWQQLTIESTVPAGSVTVFIYATQDTPNGPMGPNKVYMDDAGLFVTGAGTPTAPTGNNGAVAVPIVPTSTPAPAYAAFVSRQGAVENGKIVHTIASGDTLAAISVAYGVPIAVLRELNGIQGGILFVGQKITIGDAPVATNTPTRAPTLALPTRAVSGSLLTNTPVGVSGFVQPTRASSNVLPPATRPTATATTTTNRPSPIVGNATVIAALASPTLQAATATPAPSITSTSAPAVTIESTEAPTTVASSTSPPAIVNTPLNPADAPTAPVITGQSGDPLATTASVCVLMFDDINQNRIQNSGETLLAGGLIILRQATTDISSYQTNGTSEPFCFDDLEPGSYTAVASAPDGYGLTTPASLVISVQAATSFRLQFGAAEGVIVAVVPTANADTTAGLTETAVDEAGGIDLASVAGLLLIGGAVVVLVGGAVVYLIARRLG